MIERLIYTVLTDGIAELTADPDAMEPFFGTIHNLQDDEVTKIREKFLADPPNVTHNYPRQDSKFPLYTIVLGNENETQKFFDDFGGVLEADEAALMGSPDLAGLPVRTSFFQHTFDVLVYTDHPDVTIWYYQLAKYFLVRGRQFFKECGLHNTTLAGEDISPLREYSPEWMFGRRLRFTCSTEFPVIGAQADQYWKTLVGAHVRGGSNSDNGGVVANVVPYVEGEE